MKIKTCIPVIIALIALITAGCASHQVPVIGSNSTNSAVSYTDYLKKSGAETETQNQCHSLREQAPEPETKTDQVKQIPETKNQQEQTKNVAPKQNSDKSGELETRVSLLERKTKQNSQAIQKNSDTLEKHSEYLRTQASAINSLGKHYKQLERNLNHTNEVVKDNNARLRQVQDDAEFGKALDSIDIRFTEGGTVPLASELRKLNQLIAENPNLTPRFIIGATDKKGSVQKNKKLAQQRADFLKEHLRQKGVNVSSAKTLIKIETHRYGVCRPQNRVAVIHYD